MRNKSRSADRTAKGRRDNVTRLHRRAVEAESEAQVLSEVPETPETATPTMSIGGMQIPSLDLANMEGTVRNVVNYVQKNPLGAAAMALGAGVVLTSMYWDQVSDTRGKRRSR